MKLKSKKSALLLSFTSLLLCFAMLAGSTFAWFTDTATTGVNKITSGNLHVEIQNKDNQKIETLEWVTKEGTAIDKQDDILWEPGCTYLLTPFKIVNTGNLALKYKIVITGLDGDSPLLDVIKFTYKVGGVESLLNEEGHLTAKGTAGASTDMITVSAHMDEAADNRYQDKELTNIRFTVYATQDTVENDSYGDQYDKDATYYPVLDAAGLKDALVNGGNIKVDSSFDAGNDTLAVNKDTVLDMNGKTISNTADIWDESKADWSLISARNDANLTITGNGTFKAKENDSFTVDVQDGATVTIEDGTFIGNIHAVYVYEGTANIKGGFYAVQQKYSVANKADGFVLNCYDANRTGGKAKIIVTGGTFVNFNPADCWAEGEHTNFVADGYSVISEQHGADTWYTVVRAADSANALKEAIGEGAPYIQLTENVDVSEVLTFENETTIDLNGKTLKSSMESSYSLVLKGDTVIKNGTYQGTGAARGITANGNLTLENVKVDVAGQVGVACSKENCTYSIQNSEIKGDYALANFANNATVTIQGSALEGKNCGLYHNGSYSGLKLNVTDTTINGGNNSTDTTGVYISGSTATVAAGGYQQATFTNCTIKGNAAVEVKYTDLTLNNCTATATVAAENASYTQNDNGATTNGFAVVSTDNATNNTMPKPEGTITINGGSYTGLIGLGSLSSMETDFPGFVDTTYIISQ